MRRAKVYVQTLPDGQYAIVSGVFWFAVGVPVYVLLGMTLDSAPLVVGGVALGSGLSAPWRRRRHARWRRRLASRFARPS